MTLPVLVGDLTSIEVPLENLFLDPNNPRFTGVGWVYVPDAEIATEDAQEAARKRLLKDFAVEKLQMNMEVNGYLPIDRVVVRSFAPDRYVVLEGNRRICAAKRISATASDGSVVPAEVLESLKCIPCLQYVGSDQDAAWVFQGLRHITGISDWSAYNKAKLLVEQMDEEGLGLTDAGRRFGLTPHGAGQWVRGYYAFKQAQEQSDYISEVDERSYPYFQELFSRSSSAVREWLGWHEGNKKFERGLEFNEFVGWLYPKPENEDGESANGRGEWERRVIKRQDDVRLLAMLLRDDREAFEQFRIHRDVGRAYAQAMARRFEREAQANVDRVAELFDTIQRCTKTLMDVPLRIVRDETSKERLIEALDALEKAIGYLRN